MPNAERALENGCGLSNEYIMSNGTNYIEKYIYILIYIMKNFGSFVKVSFMRLYISSVGLETITWTRSTKSRVESWTVTN